MTQEKELKLREVGRRIAQIVQKKESRRGKLMYGVPNETNCHSCLSMIKVSLHHFFVSTSLFLCLHHVFVSLHFFF